MRILQVFNQYLESGGEEIWVGKVSAFARDPIEVSELRFQSRDWTRKEAPARLIQARQVWDNPASRKRLRESVAESKPDILLYHNLIPVASLGLYDEAWKLGVPVVQYIHNFRPFSPSGTMWVGGRVQPAALRGNPWPEVLGRAWERSYLKTILIANYQKRLIATGMLGVVRKWIAVSDFMRESFVKAGVSPDHVVTLRHCWEPQMRPNLRAMSDHYLFLGRLVPEKGIHTLLEAWRILERELGAECPRLVIAGSGPHEDIVQRASHRMRQVVCVGFVDGRDKDDLLAGCRALIAPSIWWEPLGLIVYEAYDAARPVIAAATGGLRETVVEGLTGSLHKPGDAEDLARKVMTMESAGRQGRLEMGACGRQWLLENASLEEWQQRFLDIMKDAAGRQGPPAMGRGLQ